MQDDILTNLSKIGDLKVISRTSVMSYRGSGTRASREIRREGDSKSGRNFASDPGE
jgi:TolB-like protein